MRPLMAQLCLHIQPSLYVKDFFLFWSSLTFHCVLCYVVHTVVPTAWGPPEPIIKARNFSCLGGIGRLGRLGLQILTLQMCCDIFGGDLAKYQSNI